MDEDDVQARHPHVVFLSPVAKYCRILHYIARLDGKLSIVSAEYSWTNEPCQEQVAIHLVSVPVQLEVLSQAVPHSLTERKGRRQSAVTTDVAMQVVVLPKIEHRSHLRIQYQLTRKLGLGLLKVA
jgi:hypothetical protein